MIDEKVCWRLYFLRFQDHWSFFKWNDIFLLFIWFYDFHFYDFRSNRIQWFVTLWSLHYLEYEKLIDSTPYLHSMGSRIQLVVFSAAIMYIMCIQLFMVRKSSFVGKENVIKEMFISLYLLKYLHTKSNMILKVVATKLLM